MRVGELAERAGVSVRSLRYYEACGLIDAGRSSGGQRVYDDAVIERVAIIRRLLDAGLGTRAIADVLPCMAEPSTQTPLLTERLVAERDRLDLEIAQRQTTRDALERIIATAPASPQCEEPTTSNTGPSTQTSGPSRDGSVGVGAAHPWQ